MKKILSIALIAVMLVLALASCNKNNDPINNEPEKTVRTTITAEEWAAVCTPASFTCEVTMNSTTTRGEETRTSTSKDTTKQSDTVTYEMYEVTEEGDEPLFSEFYSFVKDGQSYFLGKQSEDDTAWIAYKTEHEFLSMLDCIGIGDEVAFEDLVYDEEKKAYVYTVDEDGIHGVATFYFEEGKLIKVNTVATGDMEDGNYTIHAEAEQNCVFSNIGTTTVELPEYSFADEQ